LVALATSSAHRVSAQSVDTVTFPNPQIEFIIGPQLTMSSNQNPHPWFNTTQAIRGALHGTSFPAVPPIVLTGTVSTTFGSVVVQGNGTRFLSEVDAGGPAPLFNGHLRIAESDGSTYHEVQVLRVDSETQLTLTSPYLYPARTGAQADTFFNQPGNGWNYD